MTADADQPVAPAGGHATVRAQPRRPGRGLPGLGTLERARRELIRRDPVDTREVMAVAGNVVVSAARVGRILGRTGWRLARQLPGGSLVEQQTQRLWQAAEHEARRINAVQQQRFAAATPEKSRAMLLVHDGAADPDPLRSAMRELLARSIDADDGRSHEYLFGTIVSQLVPDEARVLAAIANDAAVPVIDVVARTGRAAATVVLGNVSSLGPAAGVTLPQELATYLTRLHGFGLVHFGPEDDRFEGEYEQLVNGPLVRAARTAAEQRRRTTVRIVRKTALLSALGTDFWAASAPTRPLPPP